MTILSLTFRDLEYLVALSEHKNFSKAAKSCFVSQPALSAQIKKIEGYFNKIFFERQKKQVILTSDGEFIVEKARELLQQAKMLDTTFQSTREMFPSPLLVGMIHTISPYYPRYFIKNLLLKYSHDPVMLKEGYTEELVLDLKMGKIDALIASEMFYDEKLISTPLLKEPLYLIINKKHPFASKEYIALSDLNAEEMIFLKEGNCLRNESIDLCPKNRRGNIKEYHLSSLEALKYVVALQPSYAIIPKMATKLDDSLKNFVVIKELNDSNAYRQISIFTRKNPLRKKDIDAFIAVLKSDLS